MQSPITKLSDPKRKLIPRLHAALEKLSGNVDVVETPSETMTVTVPKGEAS